MDMAETCLALAGHKSGLASVAFSPDSRCVASASHDDIIRAWNARNGKPVLVLRGHNGLVNSVAFSPDGSRIASGSCDKTAMLWDAATGDPVLKLEGHAHWVFAVAFSPDGRRLATASADRTAAVWDPESAEILFRLKGHKDSVRAVAYSPNGRWIVTGGAFDGGVRLWKSSDGRAILRMEVGNEGIHAVSFSRDSRSLAVASDSRAGSVWDVLSGKQQYPLLGHTGDVLGVAFSPDGRSLGTASQDGTARVWSPQFGHCRLTLAGHKSKVWGIAFSRDNSRIATVSADGTTMLWDGHSGARMLTLCKDSDARRIGRSLAIEDSRKDLASVEGSGNLAGRPGTAIDLPIAAVSGETETERELRRQLQQREDEMRSMQEELHRLRKVWSPGQWSLLLLRPCTNTLRVPMLYRLCRVGLEFRAPSQDHLTTAIAS